jgi:hypothetical protein
VQAYSGKYAIKDANGKETGYKDFRDERMALSFIYYPMPFGFQAEYNWGVGPQINENNVIEEKVSLHGGYLQFMYQIQRGNEYLMPFIKMQYYDGSKKHETAAHYIVKEYELGVEWQPYPSFELTAVWAVEDRTIVARKSSTESIRNQQDGHRLRLQAQFNF